MKKILVIFALLAVSFASVNAQENLKWGATLGMNSSFPVMHSVVK